MRKEITELKSINVKLQDETANKSQDIEELTTQLESIKVSIFNITNVNRGCL